MKSYKTIQKKGYYLLEEKKSRFIARAKNVCSEDEAVSFIQSVREAEWDATHHCYAYLVGSDTVYQKYSDDGEPQGTAGLPILNVIKKRELMNVVVVVTRYFGGILLGAGGLTRAYGKACAGCLDMAGEAWVKTCFEFKIPVEYHLAGKLQNLLINNGFIIADIEYSECVTFRVYAPLEKKESLESNVSEITGRAVRLETGEEKSIRFDKNQKVLEDLSNN